MGTGFDGVVGAAVWMWVRADWRRRRRALVGLTLLAGVAGGVALGAAAGARRTATSFERFVDDTATTDAMVDIGDYDAELVAAVEDLPEIADARAVTLVYATIDGVETDLGLIVPRGVDDVEQERLLRGRRADRERPDEVVINEFTAQVVDVDVGDELTVATLTPEQVAAEEYFPSAGPVLQLSIVGVTRGVDDLSTAREGLIRTTPALYDTIAGEVDEFTTLVLVRVRDGVSPAELEDSLSSVIPPEQVEILTLDVRSGPARTTIAALARALAAFAAAAGLVTAMVVGQALGRHVAGAQADVDELRVLGLARAERARAAAASVLPIAVAGPLLAVVVAIVASPLTPIGLARRAEPDPGLRVDAPALAIGAIALAAVVAVAGTVSATWSARSPVARTGRLSTTANFAARAGAGAVVVNGISLALDRRRPAPPVRAGVGAVVVAAVGAVAVLTFVSSLDRLVDSPERWGYGWDALLDFTSDGVDDASDDFVADADLAAVGRLDAGQTTIEGRPVRAYGLTSLRGDIGFGLREGREPIADDEVVLGPTTAERHGVGVGDVVTIVRPGGGDAGASVDVVGIALFPEINDGEFTDAVGLGGMAFARHATIPDLFEASQIVVRFEAHADPDQVLDRLARQFPDSVNEALPVRPGDVGSLDSVRSIPAYLLVFVVLLGVASIAHTVRTTASRRRGHLATLRAVGMTTAQIVSCSVVQSVTVVVLGLVVGLPLGLAGGRLVWRAVARSIEVAADPLVPAAAVVAVAVGAVVAAVLTAVVAGGRGRPSARAGF